MFPRGFAFGDKIGFRDCYGFIFTRSYLILSSRARVGGAQDYSPSAFNIPQKARFFIPTSSRDLCFNLTL